MTLFLLLLLVFAVATLPELFALRLGRVIVEPLVLVKHTAAFVARLAESLRSGDDTVFRFFTGQTQRSFLEEVGPYFSNTLLFLAGGLVAGLLVGIGVGIVTGHRNCHRLEHILGVVGSVPDFLMALLLQFIVVGITAATGVRIAHIASLGSNRALLLPFLVMSVYPAVAAMTITSDRIQHYRGEQFVVNLVSRGISTGRIYRVHLLPGIASAIRTELPRLLGAQVATLFIAERVFQIKGIVRWMFTYMFVNRGALQLAGYQFPFTVLCLFSLLLATLIALLVVRVVLATLVVGFRHV